MYSNKLPLTWCCHCHYSRWYCFCERWSKRWRPAQNTETLRTSEAPAAATVATGRRHYVSASQQGSSTSTSYLRAAVCWNASIAAKALPCRWRTNSFDIHAKSIMLRKISNSCCSRRSTSSSDEPRNERRRSSARSLLNTEETPLILMTRMVVTGISTSPGGSANGHDAMVCIT